MFTCLFQVQQERKTARRLARPGRPGLRYSVGFVGELAGKRVCHGNCGLNPQTAGHLGCLNHGLFWYISSHVATEVLQTLHSW